MFEKASKLKLRFTSTAGLLETEDLWDLPLRGYPLSLNEIAKKVNRALKDTEEEDFVGVKATGYSADELRLDILKHIITVKKANAEKAEKSAETKAKKQRILTILEEKADDSLKGKSETELRELLDEI